MNHRNWLWTHHLYRSGP